MIAWVWLAACGSSPDLVPWSQAGLTLDVPAGWKQQANSVVDPRQTRCGPGRVELISGSTVADGVTTEGERCTTRTWRRTVRGIQIVCSETYEADGLGPPASTCKEVVDSAR